MAMHDICMKTPPIFAVYALLRRPYLCKSSRNESIFLCRRYERMVNVLAIQLSLCVSGLIATIFMKRPALLCLAGSVFLAGNASAGLANINSPLDVTVVTQNAPTGRATLTYDIYFYGLSFMDLNGMIINITNTTSHFKKKHTMHLATGTAPIFMELVPDVPKMLQPCNRPASIWTLFSKRQRTLSTSVRKSGRKKSARPPTWS